MIFLCMEDEKGILHYILGTEGCVALCGVEKYKLKNVLSALSLERIEVVCDTCERKIQCLEEE